MSEQSAESTEAQATEATEQKPDTEQTQEVNYKAEAEKWKSLAQKHEGNWRKVAKAAGDIDEESVKQLVSKAREYDTLKRSQMSEQDKAVEQARADARAEMLRETAPRLVSAEFRVAAAGRLTAEQVAELIEDLDMTKYLTESGEVDTERVTKKVDALAPKGDGKPVFPDLGQGKRDTAKPDPGPGIARLRDAYASSK